MSVEEKGEFELKSKAYKMIIGLIMLILSLQTSFGFIVFTDVENHWGQEYINWDSSNFKLLEGFEDGTFGPDEAISRGDFIKSLNNLIHSSGFYNEIDSFQFTDEINFTDIDKESETYFHIWEITNYITITSNSEIRFMDIFNGKEFLAEKPITRYEAALLSRAVTTPPLKETSYSYEDLDSSTPYYQELLELVGNGIMQGYENHLHLQKHVTRAEAATILHRIAEDFKYVTFGELQVVPIDLISLYYNQPVFQKSTSEEYKEQEARFINAITSLEYISFVGYIPHNERHLYDTKPLETLWDLKESGYENVLGLNYYLIKYDDSITNDRAVELIEEGLTHIDGLSLEEVEGLKEFFDLARQFLPAELVLQKAEALLEKANDTATLYSVGLYLIQEYEEKQDIQDVLSIYNKLLANTEDDEFKSKLLNNYVYYSIDYHGEATVFKELEEIRVRALEDREGNEKLIIKATALMKQLINND